MIYEMMVNEEVQTCVTILKGRLISKISRKYFVDYFKS